MKLRNLGRDGPQVSALGLGCMGFSEFYASSAANDAEAIGVIQNALSLGLTFLDTADMYGPYKNEILVGKAISGRRDQAFLATKFGFLRDPANPKMRGISGKADYVRASCEGSLKRLNVERIDLYYQHRVDRSTPIEETVGAMAELVKAGKVGGIGLSEPSVETIRKAHRVHHRGADGILPLEPRPRGWGAASMQRAWDRLRPLQSARPRFSHRPIPQHR
jgi:aryl-alcohol dehydrogenase-like predicted oxidoreductase